MPIILALGSGKHEDQEFKAILELCSKFKVSHKRPSLNKPRNKKPYRIYRDVNKVKVYRYSAMDCMLLR